MKKWVLVYDTKRGEQRRPIGFDTDHARIFSTVVVRDEPTTNGKIDVVVKGVSKTPEGFDTELQTVRVAHSAKHFRTERQDVGD